MATSRLFFNWSGHVALDDALGQALHDGGFAHAGLADQHRIVLGAAAQHLHHAPDLVFAPDHRVQLALAGRLGQVNGVAFERLVLGFGVLVGNALRAADRHQGLQNGVMSRAGAFEQLARRVLLLVRNGQQQVLCGDELVFEMGRFVKGFFEYLVERWGDEHGAGLPARHFGEVLQHPLAFGHDGVGVYAALFQHRPDYALPFLRKRH